MKKPLLNKELSKMLGRYGATAIAAAAAGTAANAQIIHTPAVNDTIHLGDTLQLDFNADAVADVNFTIALNPKHVDKTWGDFIFTKAIAAQGNRAIGQYWYYNSYITPLNMDQLVSADIEVPFVNGVDEEDIASMKDGYGVLSHMGWTTWGIYGWNVTQADTSVYLGYEFQISGDSFYGWVKVTFHRATEFTAKNDYNDLYLVVNEYAYESEEFSILVGATGPAVGIKKQPPAELKMYPNPSTDMVNIRLDANSNYDVNVLDITGKRVLTTNFSGQEYKLDITGLNSGIYLLQVTDGILNRTQKLVVE